MKIRSLDESTSEVVVDPSGEIVKPKVENKLLAKSMGYMALALLVTGLVGFLFAYLMATFFGDGQGYITDTGYMVLLVTLFGALIGSVIVSFTFSIKAYKSEKAPWVSYFLYSAFMGIMFGSMILVPGITFGLIGEAFGITSLVFLAMFLIGYFSKKELTGLAIFAGVLGFGLLMASLLFLPIYFFGGMQAAIITDYVITIGIIVVFAIYTAVDVSRLMKAGRHLTAVSDNIALIFAMTLYGDFMVLLIRILSLLARAKKSD